MLNEKTSKMNKLEKDNSDLINEVDSLENDLEDQFKNNQDLKKLNQDLKLEIDDLKIEIENLEDKVKFTPQAEELKNENENLRSDIYRQNVKRKLAYGKLKSVKDSLGDEMFEESSKNEPSEEDLAKIIDEISEKLSSLPPTDEKLG